jgi:hypothetical protein
MMMIPLLFPLSDRFFVVQHQQHKRGDDVNEACNPYSLQLHSNRITYSCTNLVILLSKRP